MVASWRTRAATASSTITRTPDRVANQYIVRASAPLGQRVTLPVKVDTNDQAKIAIVWDRVAKGPARAR
jgi:hypothetical protein